MRSARKVKRTSALLLAATLAALGPGIVPLPATAQDTERPPWAPPEVSVGPPVDEQGPDKNYVPKVTCVQRDASRNEPLRSRPWGQEYLRIKEVHEYMRRTVGSAGLRPNGAPIVVGVIDTGVSPHSYLPEPRLRSGEDYVLENPDGPPGLQDCDGHGTEVAGIIAANPNDPSVGFVGVAPDAHIVSIRQSSINYEHEEEEEEAAPPPNQPGGQGENPNQPGGQGQNQQPGQPEGLRGSPDSGNTGTAQNDGGNRTQEPSSGAGTVKTLAQAIMYAVDTAQVDVINISINNCRPAAGGAISEDEKSLQAAIRHAVDNNVVVVSAAGNTSEDCPQNTGNPNEPKSIVTPPWFAEDVLSVAAIDKTGSIAPFSVTGPWVSVAAPGTDIISTDPADPNQLANQTIEGDEARPIQGTSFAAPYVTGLVALVRARFPTMDARQVMDRIELTAQHPAAPGGRDNYVGYGIIDPMAALTEVLPQEQPGFQPAAAKEIPSDMPPYESGIPTPLLVALIGTGVALAGLFIAMFVVRTVRRNRPA